MRPLVFSKTLSQMWDKLNLPILLFQVGLLTLMLIDSLIFLAKGEGGNLLASQAGNPLAVHSQAGTHLPPGKKAV